MLLPNELHKMLKIIFTIYTKQNAEIENIKVQFITGPRKSLSYDTSLCRLWKP